LFCVLLNYYCVFSKKRMSNHPIIAFEDNVIVSLQRQFPIAIGEQSKDIYFDLINSIVCQQLSGAVATVIFNRFLTLFHNGYPTPELLIGLPIETLRSVGLSNSKANYIKSVAHFSIKNGLAISQLESMDDEGLIGYLTQIHGVGRWTAEMILIFSLNRPDVFPVDDLSIRQGMVELYGIDLEGKELNRKLVDLANGWRPNRSLASRLIWKWKDSKRVKK